RVQIPAFYSASPLFGVGRHDKGSDEQKAGYFTRPFALRGRDQIDESVRGGLCLHIEYQGGSHLLLFDAPFIHCPAPDLPERRKATRRPKLERLKLVQRAPAL